MHDRQNECVQSAVLKAKTVLTLLFLLLNLKVCTSFRTITNLIFMCAFFFVHLSVCPSVRPSVRLPSVSQEDAFDVAGYSSCACLLGLHRLPCFRLSVVFSRKKNRLTLINFIVYFNNPGSKPLGTLRYI